MHEQRLALLRRELSSRPAARIERTAGAREAGVALIVRACADLEILLVKRAERESDPWSGHMALPGGLRSPIDADLIATALREAQEEVGIPLARIGVVLGPLDDVAPRTRRLPRIVIEPTAVAVPPGTTATPDLREIDAALWVPLAELRDERAVSEILIELQDGTRVFPSLRYGDHVIWGLTHSILVGFLDVVGRAGL